LKIGGGSGSLSEEGDILIAGFAADSGAHPGDMSECADKRYRIVDFTDFSNMMAVGVQQLVPI